MAGIADRPRVERGELNWHKLAAQGRKENPDRHHRSGFSVVKAAKKASPQHHRKPRTGERLLSTPFRVEHGRESRCRFAGRRLWVVWQEVLRVSSVRARPALLRPPLPENSSRRKVSQVQPLVPAKLQGTVLSCRTTGPVSKTTTLLTSGAKSDGASCCAFVFLWQSEHRET